MNIRKLLAYNGSKGETQTAMAQTMGWQGMSLDEVNQGNESLLSLLQQAGSGIQVRIANSLWSRKGVPLHNDFLSTNQRFYKAQVTKLDFNSAQAPDTINKWASKHTAGKIPKMIESLDSAEVLILMNAVYFKGAWKKEFEPSATKEEDFKLQDGSVKLVQMMMQTGTYEYLQKDGFQAVRLPYGDGQMDMLVILPEEHSSLNALYDGLWADPGIWRQSFQMSRGEIKLPRFKIEYGTQLKKPLMAMGMSLPFDGTHADFSGMAPVPPSLFISEVTHKSFVEVNEKGTEAAAATALKMAGGPRAINNSR